MQHGPSRHAETVTTGYGVRGATLTTSPQAVMPAYLLSSAGSSQAMVYVLVPPDTPEAFQCISLVISACVHTGIASCFTSRKLVLKAHLVASVLLRAELPSMAACCT